MLRALKLLVVVLLAASFLWTVPLASSQAARTCDKYASPKGSDSHGHGSLSLPFRSMGRLDRALRPGQVGCLRAGSYGGLSALHALRRGGSPGHQITLRSFPGETALVRGWVDVEAPYLTLSHLQIDGSNTLYRAQPVGAGCRTDVSQPLVLAGRHDVLEYDNYYQSDPSLRGQGIGVGFWGDSDDTIIRFNKIHDVGQCQAYDHLIYLSHGNNVQIYGNWMWNDPHGRGVQLYPDPTNARVFDNVIDHAGEGFVVGDEAGDDVSGNQIYNNIISNSVGLPWEHIPGEAIHDLYGGRVGTNNVFHDNISYRNPGGIGRVSAVKMYDNVVANPHYVDASAHDYRTTDSVTAIVASHHAAHSRKHRRKKRHRRKR